MALTIPDRYFSSRMRKELTDVLNTGADHVALEIWCALQDATINNYQLTTGCLLETLMPNDVEQAIKVGFIKETQGVITEVFMGVRVTGWITERRAKKSEAGRRAANIRWHSQDGSFVDETADNADACEPCEPMQTHVNHANHASYLLSSSSDSSYEESSEDSSLEPKTDITSALEQLYELYPRKGTRASGLTTARRKFKTLTQVGQLTEAVSNYKRICERERTKKEYICLWKTFVTSRWKDYLTENLPPEPSGSGFFETF